MNSDPFDPEAATCPAERVPLRRVVDLLQVPHNPERVAAYRLAMQSGARFPPIAVIRVGGRYLVADGHKRLQAYLGLPSRPADLLVERWPLKRWLSDQARQLRGKAGQYGTALRHSFREPRMLGSLVAATLCHWWRVLRSLLGLAAALGRFGR